MAVTDACGISPEDSMRISQDIADQLCSYSVHNIGGKSESDLRATPSIVSIWGRMGAAVETALRDNLPDNAHELCNGGRVGITVTPLRSESDMWVWRKAELVTHFQTREDLIQACLCSSHIPYYLDGKLARKWRGQWWVDGGMRDIIPPIVGATESDGKNEDLNSTISQDCVLKSCPYETLKYIGKGLRPRRDHSQIISPGFSEFSLLFQLLPWTFRPTTPDNLMALYEAGRRQTDAWLDGRERQ